MAEQTLTTTHASTSRSRPWRAWLAKHGLKSIVLPIGLTLALLWTLFPYVWILATSLKPNRDIFVEASIIPKRFTLEHYRYIFNNDDFRVYFRNSAVVAISTTAIAMVIAVLAAYALTRLRFAGRGFLARATIVTYLIPASLLFIPLFQVAFQLRLTDKVWGLVVVYLIFSVPFSTWMTISYFNTVPSELQDAALVDGASRLRALFSIFIPLSLPALAVVALFTFTVAWNEFLFALLLIGRDSQKTIPVGLTEFVRGDTYQWGRLMAGSLIASLPPVLIYFVSQRWVVSGLAGGAVKG
ncbi:MAG TPA: carbohydrate ABC transporter permease [Thermomicrobiales bacterium]|nr:carbohydrate ABC transporter permease [Thermomicrobiales bacterium]